MISKYSSSRTLTDNMVLGSMTSFTAGAINVASYLIFFSFSSNVTGYYAILAAELVKGNVYQIAIVLGWIFLFFIGAFVANLLVVANYNRTHTYLAHFLPLFSEIVCLSGVGVYGMFYYGETLFETEMLLSILLFAMGLQNGFTASISNFAVKTTHLTGATTDMGILFALFTKKEYRENQDLRDRAAVLVVVSFFYVAGGVFSAYLQINHGFRSFFFTCVVLLAVMIYDFTRIRTLKRSSLAGERLVRSREAEVAASANVVKAVEPQRSGASL